MKKHNKILTIITIIIVVALIILPTGTPEDAVTTIPIIASIGWKNFLILCLILIAILFIVFNIKETKSYASEVVNKFVK